MPTDRRVLYRYISLKIRSLWPFLIKRSWRNACFIADPRQTIVRISIPMIGILSGCVAMAITFSIQNLLSIEILAPLQVMASLLSGWFTERSDLFLDES